MRVMEVMYAAAAVAAAAAAFIWPTAITRRNIKQQDNVNKQTPMLFVVVTLLLKVHINIHYKTSLFLVAPPTLEITTKKKLRGNTN
jgi:hypothetical protein